ncbi:MAG: hypothetical protein HFH80_11970 [Lachnospiraceae bacterium]|nr:hypothetical protein [Lachnospiraceae bacterium]
MKKDLTSKMAKSLKIALAALLAAAVAEGLGLQYATTAGIITILSIQGTKLETFQTAGKRALAFLCALVLAWVCYETAGYNVWAFGVFLFLFVLLCLLMNWQEAIAMDSVLASHFLGQGAFFPLLGNEVLLFVVGTGFGILVNLHLRSRRERFTLVSDQVDGQIKEILGDMACCLAQDETGEVQYHAAPQVTDDPEEEHPKEKGSKEEHPEEKCSGEECLKEEHPKEKYPKEEHPKEKYPKEEHPEEKCSKEEHPEEKYPKEECSKDGCRRRDIRDGLIPRTGDPGEEESSFDKLREALRQAENCAVANYGNAPFSRDTYELDYVRMRQQQAVILQAVYDNIRGISYLPKQAGQVAGLLEQIRQEYHRHNNVEGLLEQLWVLLGDMQTQPLPRSREEFEARAVLFYILKQLEELLEIKKGFIQARQRAHSPVREAEAGKERL